MKIIDSKSIEEAYDRVKRYITKTPLISNDKINNQFGAKIFFKLENEQITGSFKIRGALNKILQLNDEQKERGIVAYSSGNHAQAVSYASKLLKIKSVIVMPSDAPKIKIKNTKKYGAEIILYNRENEDREKIAVNLAKKTGRTLIKPFNDKDIIIGQGTAGLEISNELIKNNVFPDVYLCCCSGGGLIAGTSIYLKHFFSDLLVYSVEPEYYDDMRISLEKGKLISINTSNSTICDALTVKVAGDLTFNINRKLVKKGLVVSENEVKNAVRFLKNNLNIISEPGGAAPTAALLSKADEFYGKVIVVMVSGGNVDKYLINRIMNNE